MSKVPPGPQCSGGKGGTAFLISQAWLSERPIHIARACIRDGFHRDPSWRSVGDARFVMAATLSPTLDLSRSVGNGDGACPVQSWHPYGTAGFRRDAWEIRPRCRRLSEARRIRPCPGWTQTCSCPGHVGHGVSDAMAVTDRDGHRPCSPLGHGGSDISDAIAAMD
jgi:hypothetical protein